MTAGMDLLMELEIVRAVIWPIGRIVGMDMALFFLGLVPTIWIYLKTENISVPAMFFMVYAGTITVGRWFSSSQYPVMPEVFDATVFLIILGAILWLFYAAYVKQSR